MYTKFISIIIATYNSANTLEETILSVINQDFNDYELIIIDGASQDITIDIIKKYEHHISYWISEKDKGIYDAWNKGVTVSKGSWITFLGSDDQIYSTTVLSSLIEYLSKAEELKIRYVYGVAIKIEPISKRVIKEYKIEWNKLRKTIRKSMEIPHWFTFHHKNLFLENGMFNTDFKIAGDYEFLLREFKNDKKSALFFPFPTVIVSEGGLSGNLNSILLMTKEQMNAQRKNNFIFPSILLIMKYFSLKLFFFIKSIIGYKISTFFYNVMKKINGSFQV